MKYVFLKCLYNYKKVFTKVFITQLIVLLAYTILNYNYIDNNLYSYILGINPIVLCHSTDIILKMIMIISIMYITYNIYLKLITTNTSAFLLRINSKNILLYGLACLAIIILFHRLLNYIISYFILKLFSDISFYTLDLLFLDYIYYLFISICGISLINFANTKKIFILFAITSIIFILFVFFYINIFYLLIVTILLIIVNYYIFNSTYIYNYYFKK